MSKALNELKKATLASYLSKAGSRIRAGTSLGKSFDNDAGRPLKQILKHSPNVYDPNDPEGKQKDPQKLKDAQLDYDTNMHLASKFRRQAQNTVKGVALAGKKLAKEETLVEKNTESHPDLWKTHELRHKSGKALKKGDVIADFRGDKHKIKGFELPHHSGSTGRVYTNQGSFFPGVVDAKIVKKAVKEEAEQIDELKMNTAVRALRSMKSTADDYYASGEDQKRVTRFRNAIKRKWGAKGAEVADKATSSDAMKHKERGSGDSLGHGILRTTGADDVLKRGPRKGKLRPEIQSLKKAQNKGNLYQLKQQGKPNLPEEVEQIDEISRSTIAKVATARYNQAQDALKKKDFGGYVKKMGKAIKASDATTPKTGWSPEDDGKKNEEVVISPQEKYRQIKEAKIRNARKGK